LLGIYSVESLARLNEYRPSNIFSRPASPELTIKLGLDCTLHSRGGVLKLVRECYIHGIMHDEGLKFGGVEEQRIFL